VKVLLVGSGGREHALAWKLKLSPLVEELIVAPGNGGTAMLGENVPIKAEDVPALLELARSRRVDLTVVGPEAPLAYGLVDALTRVGLLAFGPTRAAAGLETSKAFSKEFMAGHGIPTAAYRTFTGYEQARGYIDSLRMPPVIKADGLAAGKGVVVSNRLDEAQDALRQMMLDREFGDAGETIVIEEKLSGQEVSLLALSDGARVAPMIPAQDHKAAYDGDEGPNTGGMGAYAPAPAMDEEMRSRVMREVIEPTVKGMADEGRRYRGVLYAGMILTERGPKTLEFNCRFGDPEAQALLPLLDADLAELMIACALGELEPGRVRWRPGACVCVVMASGGYPGHYRTGFRINGLAEAEQQGCFVFHAGTRREGNDHFTTGGRVLGVTAVGSDLREAVDKAYGGVRAISFEGAHYRGDIGAKGLALQPA